MQRGHGAVRDRRADHRHGRGDRAHAHGVRAGDTDRRHHRQAALERAVAALRVHYLPEPKLRAEPATRPAVLLINLGTPDAPTPQAVRRYLKQFLSDPRVVEIPSLLWQIILRLLILPFRGAASAKKYAAVWMPEGSPLRVHTEKQVEGLRHLLQVNDYAVIVDYAMR